MDDGMHLMGDDRSRSYKFVIRVDDITHHTHHR
jgi:hypothetical protein